MKNLMVLFNNYKFISEIFTNLKCLFESYKNIAYLKPDLLIYHIYRGALLSKKAISNKYMKNLIPHSDNIYAYIDSGVVSLNSSKDFSNNNYENILFLSVYRGAALVNKKIEEIGISYKKKIIIPSGADIDKFYIIKLKEYYSKKHKCFIIKRENDIDLINNFILDCKNIVTPPSYLDYFPMKDCLHGMFYSFPFDFEIYQKLSESEGFYESSNEREYNFIRMQIFTKAQSMQTFLNIINFIAKNKRYISQIGLFYKPLKSKIFFLISFLKIFFRKLIKEFKNNNSTLKVFEKHKENIISNLKVLTILIEWIFSKGNNFIKEIHSGLPLKQYYAQLESFNSLYIQRRGGMITIKYAASKGLIIFGEPYTPNSRRLINDYGIQVINLEDFNKGKYNKNDIIRIIELNRNNIIKNINKSKGFWINIFSS